MHVLPLVLQLFVSLQRVLWQLPESCNRMLRKHFRCSTAGALCPGACELVIQSWNDDDYVRGMAQGSIMAPEAEKENENDFDWINCSW